MGGCMSITSPVDATMKSLDADAKATTPTASDAAATKTTASTGATSRETSTSRAGARVHRVGVSQGGADGTGPAHCGCEFPRAEVPGQRVYRSLNWAGAGWSAGHGGRDSPAVAVPVRSGNAEADQRGRDGLHGHPPEPCGAVCRIWISREAGCSADRGHGGAGGWAPGPVVVGGE